MSRTKSMVADDRTPYRTASFGDLAPPRLVIGLAEQVGVTLVLLTLGWVHDSTWCLCAGFVFSPLGRLLAGFFRSVPHASQRAILGRLLGAAALVVAVVAVSAAAAWANAERSEALLALHGPAARQWCLVAAAIGVASLLLGRSAGRGAGALLVIASATATFPFALAGAIVGTAGIELAVRFFQSHAGVTVVVISVAAILADACIAGVTLDRECKRSPGAED